ncbi:MAG: helix-turn-helix domain-containing protein [Verrucomicrobiota bacterium]
MVASDKALQTLGDRIREARKVTGLSQEELALQADIDRSFMGQVERGQRNISVLTLLRVARVLDINLGSLLDGLGGVGGALADGVTDYKAKKPRAKGLTRRGRVGKAR